MANSSKAPLVSSLLLFLLLLSGLYAAPLIQQEGNPLPIVRAILSVELTANSIAPITELKLLQKTGENEPLNEFLASYGFEQRDQLGSAYIYEDGDRQLVVISRMYSRRYIIYELEYPLP